MDAGEDTVEVVTVLRTHEESFASNPLISGFDDTAKYTLQELKALEMLVSPEDYFARFCGLAKDEAKHLGGPDASHGVNRAAQKWDGCRCEAL